MKNWTCAWRQYQINTRKSSSLFQLPVVVVSKNSQSNILNEDKFTISPNCHKPARLSSEEVRYFIGINPFYNKMLSRYRAMFKWKMPLERLHSTLTCSYLVVPVIISQYHHSFNTYISLAIATRKYIFNTVLSKISDLESSFQLPKQI